MAKQQKEVKKFEFSKVGGIMDNIAKTVPIQIEKELKQKEFISTGNYLLNAALSSNIYRGIKAGKIFGVCGPSGCGKSFIAYSISRQAQKQGYSVIYIDTEESIELEQLPNYGLDINLDKFRLVRTNKVEDVNIFITQILDELKVQKLAGYELPKILLVVDSIGMMSSNKEKEDLLKGEVKQDMTRAKQLNALFRSISGDLGYLDIPAIFCNHTYMEIGSYVPQQISKGGQGLVYAASVLGFLNKSKLKDGSEDSMDLGQSGIVVTFQTQKNRLAKPKKIKFEISFNTGLNAYTGLEDFCRPEFFDKIGIAQGKMELDKSTGELSFKPGGIKWYVRHLDKSLSTKNLFNSKVFTTEVLDAMEPILYEYFRYKNLYEIEEAEKEFEQIIEPEDEEDDSPLSADDLF